MDWRGSSIPAGRRTPCPGLVSLRSHIGRCSTASASVPSGAVTGSGKKTVSLLWKRFRSMSSSSWYRNSTGPRRRHSRRSSDTAIAVRGPSGPYATYVMTCRPRASIHVVRGSSTPALPTPRSQPRSGSSTTPSRSTATGTPSSTTTRASPTRETFPSATRRGSRYSSPSGPRPEAGLSTPSASFGSPGCGVITTPIRVSRYGIEGVVPGMVILSLRIRGRCW
jgi:hypothetical protein